MNSVREIAKAIIAETGNSQKECTPEGARYYRRLAVITYADFLKRSLERSDELNKQRLEEVWLYAERAISCGAQEKTIEESFERLRKYWIPRLGEEKPRA